MKRLLISLAVLVVLNAAAGDEPKVDEAIAKFMIAYEKHDSYKSVEYKALKASKKDYKSKKVYYSGIFVGFTDAIPEYIEDSGYSAKRYFMIGVNGKEIPVMLKRSKDHEALMAKLKNGCKVRVYGRMKEFRDKPKRGFAPEYCFEVAFLKVLDPRAGKAADQGGDQPVRKPRRPFRR